MLEHYYVQRRNYYRDGGVRNEFKRSYFRADNEALRTLCYSGVQVAGMVLKTALMMGLRRNPYSLPR
jgi:hypothetical protein